MKFSAFAAAAIAAGGLATAGDLTPIPAPLPAPNFSGPTYAPPAPTAPVYEPAPLYGPPSVDHGGSYGPGFVEPAPGMVAPAPYSSAPYSTAPLAPYGRLPGVVVPAPRVPVKYRDLKNIAPCAVPQTVCVDGECGVQFVEICAPLTCVDVKRKRNKTVFDYGDYEVEIRSRRRGLVVDYDD